MSGKPLQWKDTSGNEYTYYRRPMLQAAIFILTLEACERFAYYGFIPIFTTYLESHVGMSDSAADSYNQLFNSLAYFTPLVSSIICDLWLGPFWTIFIFAVVYTAGLVILAISALSSAHWLVHLAFMGLIAVGTGGIKAAVNVFGAQQFHPEEHKGEISSYYTYFYASINVGGLFGGIIVPIVQKEVSYFVAFLIPAVSFVIGITVFTLGSPRYVRMKSQGSVVMEIIKVYGYAIWKMSFQKCKESNGGKFPDNFIDDSIQFIRLFPIFVGTIPFLMAYGQMATSWVTQGLKMDPNLFGWDMPPQLMQNVDSIGVLVVSVCVDGLLYRRLRARGKMLSIPVRFFIGSLCGVAALLCSYGVEKAVMNADKLYTVPIWWQVPQYFLIASGEIFLISSSYEVAFVESPNCLKVVASAICLLFISIANLISGAVFAFCASWMPKFDSDSPDPTSWSGKYDIVHYDYLFLMLAGVCVVGAIFGLLLKPYYTLIHKSNQNSSMSIDKPTCVSRRDLPHRKKHEDAKPEKEEAS